MIAGTSIGNLVKTGLWTKCVSNKPNIASVLRCPGFVESAALRKANVQSGGGVEAKIDGQCMRQRSYYNVIIDYSMIKEINTASTRLAFDRKRSRMGNDSSDFQTNIEIAASLIDVDTNAIETVYNTADAMASYINPLHEVGALARQAILTFGLMAAAKRKASAVRYVANADVARQKILADMRRREIQAQHSEAILYIDRAFQAECDHIAADYRYRTKALESNERMVLEAIRSYAEVRFKEIDAEYSLLMQDQQTLLKEYRNFIHYGIRDKKDIAAESVRKITDVLTKNIVDLPPLTAEILGKSIVGIIETMPTGTIDEFVRLQGSMSSRSTRL